MAENDAANADNAEKVTIEGKEYALDQLSEDAKAQVANIRYVDKELMEIKNKTAVLQAGRQFYLGILLKELGHKSESH